MLQLLKRINRVPDFSIYVTHPRHSGSKLLAQRLAAYEAAFAPSRKANIVMEIEP